ncbi:uncharacterized protein DNG_08584 [Cephalotrichum gorgonifer]|uniref:Uncharacterized protein n=1 Tax=Cephalotrichum gorgonifer TaxID=2041049 RepID=A0AAE8SYH6_9PEZI|nr:uncharacterized protein DNG_08584 [Cephalotrichum gorgonifer]
MAPIRHPPPTYHIVPRFDIAAKGGVLELGTVLDDLLMLRPLNRGDIVPIPAKLRYPPVTHSGFTDTRSRLREGHGSIWAKALVFQGAGASASASAQNETQRTVACESVVTSYFDPDVAYVAQSLAARGVNDHFVGSGYEDDVYLVTGIKVAKKLRFDSTTSAQRAANAEMGAKEPVTGTQVGGSAGGSANDGHEVEFEADDIVVGFRVRRYTYVPASRNPFSKKKKLSGEDYLENAEMHEAGTKVVKGPEVTYEEVTIEEELDAQRDAEASGELDECWVTPFK